MPNSFYNGVSSAADKTFELQELGVNELQGSQTIDPLKKEKQHLID